MCSRSIDEISGILASAKLSVQELIPLSQEITFGSELSGTDLRLLELEKEIGDCIKVGDRLVVRGERDDTAVLCSTSASFELKNVETSNSLLIFNRLSFPEDADKLYHGPNTGADTDAMEIEDSSPPQDQLMNCGRNQFIGKRSILHVAHSYYELTKVKPTLSRIQRILESSSYAGPIEEDDMDMNGSEGKGYVTFEALLDKVPGSEKEIGDFITSNLRTLEIDGNIRLVDEDYLFRTLSQVLDCIDSNSWKVTKIEKDLVIRELAGLHPAFVLEKIFDWFFQPEPEDSDRPGDSLLFAMKEYEINRFLGTMILRAGGKFSQTDFLLAWGESVPNGLQVNLKQLEGLAITDAPVGSPPVIWYFPDTKLPETIHERFQALFEAKTKWKQEEILPYLQNVAVSSKAASALLTKHARVYNAGGTKYCCSKHGK